LVFVYDIHISKRPEYVDLVFNDYTLFLISIQRTFLYFRFWYKGDSKRLQRELVIY